MMTRDGGETAQGDPAPRVASVARLIERMERVSKGLRAMTMGSKGTNLSVPRAVLEHHSSAVDGVLADLRGLDGATPERKVTARDRHAVLLAAWDAGRGGWWCAKCAAHVTERSGVHVDHVVPLARGGSNGRENLQILCAACNLAKGAA